MIHDSFIIKEKVVKITLVFTNRSFSNHVNTHLRKSYSRMFNLSIKHLYLNVFPTIKIDHVLIT